MFCLEPVYVVNPAQSSGGGGETLVGLAERDGRTSLGAAHGEGLPSAGTHRTFGTAPWRCRADESTSSRRGFLQRQSWKACSHGDIGYVATAVDIVNVHHHHHCTGFADTRFFCRANPRDIALMSKDSIGCAATGHVRDRGVQSHVEGLTRMDASSHFDLAFVLPKGLDPRLVTIFEPKTGGGVGMHNEWIIGLDFE